MYLNRKEENYVYEKNPVGKHRFRFCFHGLRFERERRRQGTALRDKALYGGSRGIFHAGQPH